MKASRAPDYLGHITEAIDRIDSYLAGMTRDEFLLTTLVQDAVVRNFEIIGEAARNIEREAPEVASTYPDIPWSVMAAMRNRLAHGYFSVDYEAVWAAARENLPPLRPRIQDLLSELL